MSNDFQASSLNARPLHGVRVLDLSRVLAGPYAAMMLADLGAEVIKVENPAHGDDSRTYTAPERDGHAVYFLTVNRAKKASRPPGDLRSSATDFLPLLTVRK